MNVETVAVSAIKPAGYNPRKDLRPGDPEYEKLKRSLAEFGYIDPIIWNRRTGNLVGGHQRFKILVDGGASEVQAVVVDFDERKEKAANVALNKVQGAWDFPKLKDVLVELDDGSFDVSLTGFDSFEIKQLVDYIAEPEQEQSGPGALMERFFMPPFTVLDTRQGYWQARKAAWIGQGIQSELGRGERKSDAEK